MGSTSKNPPFSSDSIDGLKFGQKIYFEDVGIGTSAKSGGGSSSDDGGGGKPPPVPAKKGSGGGGQPPRCQVEGCRLDLSDAKAYYGRHKVCGVHSKTPKVIVNGIEQRFCQQCSRFHQLPEFDQGKRSCRRRLAGHNERRRKPPPGSLFSAPYGRLSSSVFESSKGGGFLMDFSKYPNKVDGQETTWPNIIRQPNNNNHSTPIPKTPPNIWHTSDSINPSSAPFLQGMSNSSGSHRHHYPVVGPIVPFTGTSNSGCALSLLSNQTWAPPQDGPVGPFEGAHMVQSTMAITNGVHGDQFSGALWGFKGYEQGSGSHDNNNNNNNQYSGEIGSGQNSDYAEHSRAFDSSTQFMNWSL